MKLVSYKRTKQDTKYRIGFIYEDQVFDLKKNNQQFTKEKNSQQLTHLPAAPEEFFSKGFSAINKAQQIFKWVRDTKQTNDSYPLEDIKLGPPNPNPGKIICVGLNYADHVSEMGSEVQQHPVLFSKFANALIGPEDSIEKNPLTEKLDYEVELVIVIGKEATRVSREEAHKYIAGYTIGNDISARDLQKRTPQWLQGKSLDRSTPIGPWVMTADEISDPGNLNIRSYVNDELRQDSNTNQFIFEIPYLVEFISHLITLQPGDLIFTGSPEGVGMGMSPQTFLQTDDVVTVEIDNIGTFTNQVIHQER